MSDAEARSLALKEWERPSTPELAALKRKLAEQQQHRRDAWREQPTAVRQASGGPPLAGSALAILTRADCKLAEVPTSTAALPSSSTSKSVETNCVMSWAVAASIDSRVPSSSSSSCACGAVTVRRERTGAG